MIWLGKSQSKIDKVWVSIAWTLAVIMLIVSAVGYRLFASYHNIITKTPVALPVPLSEFPVIVGNWFGRDVPISDTILDVAANDDFLSRLYANKSNNQWINIYIAYTARPRTMLGHRPQVCYPANGWTHENTENVQFISNSGRTIRCLLHNFKKSTPETEKIVVLNYYIINGWLTDDDSVFSGLSWRSPNIDGNPARYVAQVQFSSLLEMSVRSAAKDFTDLILDYFPDENGQVKASEDLTSDG
jgi:hypothetical protein